MVCVCCLAEQMVESIFVFGNSFWSRISCMGLMYSHSRHPRPKVCPGCGRSRMEWVVRTVPNWLVYALL